MLHVPCVSDRYTFASLVEVLQAQGVVHCLGVLRSAGVKSAWDLENKSKSELRSLLGDVALDALVAVRKTRRTPSRPDVPVVHPYARGSLQRLGLGDPSKAMIVDLAKADKEFLEDRFARTSRAPRDSRWKTWLALCSSRGFQPLPVTVELINAVGSLLKAGRYRSASQYFAIAKSKHVEAGHPWSQAMDLARSQAVRSITRGIGPSMPKLDLHLELAPAMLDETLKAVANRLRIPTDLRLPFMGPTAVAASWFLLRGIEISNVQCRDVTFQCELYQVTLQLPVSKVDTEAKGCARTHCCVCRGGRQTLCVFHALLDIVTALRSRQAWRPEAYLFGCEGLMPTARQVSTLARCCAVALGQASLDEWSSGALDRWAQHSFRVAGAQFLARSGVDVAVIQLIGRWGSNAIFRYVQTAAFVPERAACAVANALGNQMSHEGSACSASRTRTPSDTKDFRQMVRDLVSECTKSKDVLVHNPRTKFAHKPSSSESALDSSCWLTACGKWRYGISRCVRNVDLLPGYQACKNCFGSVQLDESSSADASEESACESSDGSA
ncbi:ftsH [Symbiodinium natans]|uniref:FtsH protein n=1 Tax=Symbiodinium natans TaxID=878477 RepID=A0A812JG70_9DINO|nr:ftsH [Symbiodinium natans]